MFFNTVITKLLLHTSSHIGFRSLSWPEENYILQNVTGDVQAFDQNAVEGTNGGRLKYSSDKHCMTPNQETSMSSAYNLTFSYF